MKEFVGAHINSVLGLELLLLLRKNKDKSWKIDEVSFELHLTRDIAELHLNELVKSGLLVVTDDAAMSYRYKPYDDQIDSTVSELAALYSAHPVAVLTRIFDNSVDRVREFKEAFRLIKGVTSE